MFGAVNTKVRCRLVQSVCCLKLLFFLASDQTTRRQRCEHICSSQCTEPFPDVCPLHIATEQIHQVTGAEVNVNASNDQRRDRVQQKARQREHKPERHTVRRSHLNNSTVANGSADHGRKRLIVNLVGCPGVTSTCK